MNKCDWYQDDPDYSYYDTSCKHTFILNEGTPEENEFKFCPFCGKEIETSKPELEDD